MNELSYDRYRAKMHIAVLAVCSNNRQGPLFTRAKQLCLAEGGYLTESFVPLTKFVRSGSDATSKSPIGVIIPFLNCLDRR